MPINQIEPRFYQPIEQPQQPAQDQFADEQQPVEESKPGWQWIGSPVRPEAKKFGDGISDLFEVDNDPDTDDLVSVDVEEDIVDSDPDGSLESLITVTEEDIMGDELGQSPLDKTYERPRQRRIPPRTRQTIRYQPPTSLGGLR